MVQELPEDPLTQLRSHCQRLRKQGASFVDLSMINPDLTPHQLLIDRLIESSLKGSSHRYTVAKGLKRLREAFAYKYQNVFGVSLDVDKHICVTDGSKDAILQVLGVLQQQGKENILLPCPTYPAYLSAVKVLSGFEVHTYPVDVEESETVAAIRSILETHADAILILNYPNNPTSRTLSSQGMETITRYVEQFDVTCVNDFVYGEMGTSGPHTSLLSLSAATGFKNMLEVYSLSKAYSVAGWRVAGLMGDSSIISDVSLRKARTGYGIFSPVQIASIAALTAPAHMVQDTVTAYERRENAFSAPLREVGMEISSYNGGCSVWAKLPSFYTEELGYSGYSFCKSLVDHCGIIALPGESFGDTYRNFVRFALVQPESQLRTASHQIRDYIQSLSSTEEQPANQFQSERA